jgi:hypothetical protein
MYRHSEKVDALRQAVFEGDGAADRKVREAAGRNEGLPEELRAYVDKVHKHAYKVTDEDVAALRKGGYSQDQLFDITVAAATGAALKRLHVGLAALRGEKLSPDESATAAVGEPKARETKGGK